jgi:hypothetical protein
MQGEKRRKTNRDLQKDLIDELAWEPSLDAAAVGVSVKNGIVSQNGVGKSLNEKWVAERVTQRVDGVRAVTDQLIVKLPDWHAHDFRPAMNVDATFEVKLLIRRCRTAARQFPACTSEI